MSLLAYNLTTAPLPLAAGAPIVTLPASATAGARGPAFNVTGDLKGQLASAFALLQAQVIAKTAEFEWSDLPEFNTFTLVVGSAQEDASAIAVELWCDPAGADTNPGSLTAPFATPIAMFNAMPAIYHKGCRLHLNIDPTTSAQNTAKKTYTLPDEAVEVLFPHAQGSESESTFLKGGFTNELGDLPCAAGGTSTQIPTNTPGAGAVTLNQFQGMQVTIVSGAGSTNAPRVIEGNSAGANFTIDLVSPYLSPDGIAPPATTDATSVFRIGAANVVIEHTQRLAFIPSPQNLFHQGIKYALIGTGDSIDFQVGIHNASGGGGAQIFTGCEWDGSGDPSSYNLRIRGTARAQFSGDPEMWTGPNNPFIDDQLNCGNFLHDLFTISSNVGGESLGEGNYIRRCNMRSRTSRQVWKDSTFDHSNIVSSGVGALWDVVTGASDGSTPDKRSLFRNNAAGGGGNPVIRIQALGGIAATLAGEPGIDFSEFRDNNADLVVVELGGTAYLGDIISTGTNTGWGCKVRTGGKVVVTANSHLVGALGEFQVDNGPNLTLAQVLAPPFNGTLQSDANLPYPIPDPGTGLAIPVTQSGSVALVLGGGAETNTLAIPTYVGQEISFSVNTNAGVGARTITAASAINLAGNTHIALALAGASVTLRGMKVAGALAWRVVENDGGVLT